MVMQLQSTSSQLKIVSLIKNQAKLKTLIKAHIQAKSTNLSELHSRKAIPFSWCYSVKVLGFLYPLTTFYFSDTDNTCNLLSVPTSSQYMKEMKIQKGANYSSDQKKKMNLDFFYKKMY